MKRKCEGLNYGLFGNFKNFKIIYFIYNLDFSSGIFSSKSFFISDSTRLRTAYFFSLNSNFNLSSLNTLTPRVSRSFKFARLNSTTSKTSQNRVYIPQNPFDYNFSIYNFLIIQCFQRFIDLYGVICVLISPCYYNKYSKSSLYA